MVEEIKEKKKVVKNEEVVVGEIMKCDICGKIIYDTRNDKEPKDRLWQHWWEVTTGHNDWENDSWESIEHYDTCSVYCLQNIFDEYKEESNNENNSKYIEVRHGSRLRCL